MKMNEDVEVEYESGNIAIVLAKIDAAFCVN